MSSDDHTRHEVPPSRAEEQQGHADGDRRPDAPPGAQHRGEMPRDGQDQGGDGPPVADRPGDAGLDGMRVSGPGEVTPAPEDASEAPAQDPVVDERRDHLRGSSAS